MKIKHYLLLVLALCLVLSAVSKIVYGAESVAVVNYDGAVMNYIEWTWVCEEDGEVSGDETGLVPSGVPIKLVTYPSSTAAPTDNYDITIVDENGYDILLNNGLNRDTALGEIISGDSLSPWNATTLEPKILNAGVNKGGIIRLYYRKR